MIHITQWYAVWPDPRSRSRRSESCENGRFQSLSPPPVCMYTCDQKTISKFWRDRFLIFILVRRHVTFKLKVFQHLRQTSYEASSRNPVRGLFLKSFSCYSYPVKVIVICQVSVFAQLLINWAFIIVAWQKRAMQFAYNNDRLIPRRYSCQCSGLTLWRPLLSWVQLKHHVPDRPG